jgi:hypothetical protein
MWPVVVVLVGEAVEEGLEFGDGVWLGGLGAEPFLQGLLEAFGLSAGGRMVGPGVLLDDVQASEFCFEGVASAAVVSRREISARLEE